MMWEKAGLFIRSREAGARPVLWVREKDNVVTDLQLIPQKGTRSVECRPASAGPRSDQGPEVGRHGLNKS